MDEIAPASFQKEKERDILRRRICPDWNQNVTKMAMRQVSELLGKNLNGFDQQIWQFWNTGVMAALAFQDVGYLKVENLQVQSCTEWLIFKIPAAIDSNAELYLILEKRKKNSGFYFLRFCDECSLLGLMSKYCKDEEWNKNILLPSILPRLREHFERVETICKRFDFKNATLNFAMHVTTDNFGREDKYDLNDYVGSNGFDNSKFERISFGSKIQLYRFGNDTGIYVKFEPILVLKSKKNNRIFGLAIDCDKLEKRGVFLVTKMMNKHTIDRNCNYHALCMETSFEE